MSNSCPCSPTTYRCRSRLRLPHQTLPRRLIKIATMMRKLLHRRINNNNKNSSSSSPRMSLEKWKARARITSHHHHKPPRTRRLLPLMVIPSSIQKELRGKTLYIYSHIAHLKKKKSRTHVAKYLSFNIDILKNIFVAEFWQIGNQHRGQE